MILCTENRSIVRRATKTAVSNMELFCFRWSQRFALFYGLPNNPIFLLSVKYMNQTNTSTASGKEQGLNLVDMLVFFLSNWKWFLLSVLLFGSLAWMQ